MSFWRVASCTVCLLSRSPLAPQIQLICYIFIASVAALKPSSHSCVSDESSTVLSRASSKPLRLDNAPYSQQSRFEDEEDL